MVYSWGAKCETEATVGNEVLHRRFLCRLDPPRDLRTLRSVRGVCHIGWSKQLPAELWYGRQCVTVNSLYKNSQPL